MRWVIGYNLIQNGKWPNHWWKCYKHIIFKNISPFFCTSCHVLRNVIIIRYTIGICQNIFLTHSHKTFAESTDSTKKSQVLAPKVTILDFKLESTLTLFHESALTLYILFIWNYQADHLKGSNRLTLHWHLTTLWLCKCFVCIMHSEKVCIMHSEKFKMNKEVDSFDWLRQVRDIFVTKTFFQDA